MVDGLDRFVVRVRYAVCGDDAVLKRLTAVDGCEPCEEGKLLEEEDYLEYWD